MPANLNAKTLSFLKRVLTSRVGHLLLVLNFCVIAFEYSRTPAVPYEVGGDCFTVSEAQLSTMQIGTSLFPQWLVAFAWLNFPALIIASVFTALLEMPFPGMCVQTASQIFKIVFIAFGSAQWLLVGYATERLVKEHLRR